MIINKIKKESTRELVNRAASTKMLLSLSSKFDGTPNKLSLAKQVHLFIDTRERHIKSKY